MPIINPNDLELIDNPELIIGIVAAVGTPLPFVCRHLQKELAQRGYTTEEIHLSDFLYGLNLKSQKPKSTTSNRYERITRLMDRGNELRRISGGGEVLALLAAAHINSQKTRPRSSLSLWESIYFKPAETSRRSFMVTKNLWPSFSAYWSLLSRIET